MMWPLQELTYDYSSQRNQELDLRNSLRVPPLYQPRAFQDQRSGAFLFSFRPRSDIFLFTSDVARTWIPNSVIRFVGVYIADFKTFRRRQELERDGVDTPICVIAIYFFSVSSWKHPACSIHKSILAFVRTVFWRL